jgi:hypothetical protein
MNREKNRLQSARQSRRPRRTPKGLRETREARDSAAHRPENKSTRNDRWSQRIASHRELKRRAISEPEAELNIRTHERVETHDAAKVLFALHGRRRGQRFHQGTVRDISLGGLCFRGALSGDLRRAAERLDELELDIYLCLPFTQKPVHVIGRVVCLVPTSGKPGAHAFGVHFENCPRETTSAITQFLIGYGLMTRRLSAESEVRQG